MALKQRSNEWRVKRLGCVTASCFGKVLTPPKTKADSEAGKWGRTARSYMIELLTELITCNPLDTWRADSTDWGTMNEPFAFERAIPAITEEFGEPPSLPEGEFAFIEHPIEPHIGCSPDGIVGDDGMLEIKCPYNPTKIVERLWEDLDSDNNPFVQPMPMQDRLPRAYYAQIMGSLWITDRSWYAFVLYDPRLEASGVNPLRVERFERDDDYIDNTLAPKVIEFRDWLRDQYAKFIHQYAKFIKGKAPF